MNDGLVVEHQKRFNAPLDFFTCGGFAAAMALAASVEKAGSTDAEKLLPAMERLSFDTPKGKMTFRKEDHQALQAMYAFKIKVDDKLACFDACLALGADLHRAFALDLGLAQDHFAAGLSRPMATLRLLRYPPEPAGDPLLCRGGGGAEIRADPGSRISDGSPARDICRGLSCKLWQSSMTESVVPISRVAVTSNKP